MTYDIPSRFEADAERSQRIRRGINLCRTVLDGITATREIHEPDPEVTPAVAAARARAAEEKRTRAYPGDPRPIADTLRPIQRGWGRG